MGRRAVRRRLSCLGCQLGRTLVCWIAGAYCRCRPNRQSAGRCSRGQLPGQCYRVRIASGAVAVEARCLGPPTRIDPGRCAGAVSQGEPSAEDTPSASSAVSERTASRIQLSRPGPSLPRTASSSWASRRAVQWSAGTAPGWLAPSGVRTNPVRQVSTLTGQGPTLLQHQPARAGLGVRTRRHPGPGSDRVTAGRTTRSSCSVSSSLLRSRLTCHVAN